MMKSPNLAIIGIALVVALPAAANAGGLRGSPSSMKEQHTVAIEGDLTFLDDGAQVRRLVDEGALETIESNDDYAMSGVSYPYAVAEVRIFIERIAKQYREANGAQLIVTSLTRPNSQQPRNAHELSVHPAGMAVDFRIPQDATSRAWLEGILLELENAGVLDVTRERYPPHYHVAVFPVAYAAYVERLDSAKKPAIVAELPAATVASTQLIASPVVSASSIPARPNYLLMIATMIGIGSAVVLAARKVRSDLPPAAPSLAAAIMR